MKPARSKKFFVARWPGSANASTPMQPAAVARATSSVAIASPTPTARASGSTYRSPIDREPAAVAERLELERAVTDDDVVDGAREHDRVVARQQLGEHVGDGLGRATPAPPTARRRA